MGFLSQWGRFPFANKKTIAAETDFIEHLGYHLSTCCQHSKRQLKFLSEKKLVQISPRENFVSHYVMILNLNPFSNEGMFLLNCSFQNHNISFLKRNLKTLPNMNVSSFLSYVVFIFRNYVSLVNTTILKVTKVKDGYWKC